MNATTTETSFAARRYQCLSMDTVVPHFQPLTFYGAKRHRFDLTQRALLASKNT
jgi:hypothetical protein